MLQSMRLRQSKRKIYEDSMEKDDRAKQKKRKVSEMLGPAWTKEELEVFYRAYRKHGRNWKKVAAAMRNRTIDMVEALYNANKAYLSLPEGAASAAGLIAMMTDQYETRRSKPGSTRQSGSGTAYGGVGSGYGGPSPAKKPRTNRPRVAGNRLPHFLLEETEGRKPRNSKSTPSKPQHQEDNDSDEYDFNNVVKAVALTLAEASQNGSPPQSETPRKGSRENGSGKATKLRENSSGSDAKDDFSGEIGNDSVKLRSRGTSHAAGLPDTSSTGETRNKRRPPSKRLKMQRENAEEHSSRTEQAKLADREVLDMGAVEDSKPQKTRFQPQRMKKRSRQLFSGDENNGLDTLATLADLSLSGLLPSPTFESDTKGTDEGPPEQHKFQELVSQVLSLQVERVPVKKELQDFKEDKADAWDQKQSGSPDTKKKKKRTSGDKNSGAGEASTSGKQEEKGLPSVYKPHGRAKRISTTRSMRQTSKYDGFDLEHDSTQEGRLEDSASNHAEGLDDSSKLRMKKKIINDKSAEVRPGLELHPEQSRVHCPHTTAELASSSAKAKLIHCVSIPKVRQWCAYEWFYSAIDLPWFARNEFVEYLNHAGLGHVSKLTRVEWGVIRSSLGKPRRLSQKFLQEEREKLETYRESVRAHYQEVRNGLKDALPPDLARPLTVGQRVIARHPKSGEIHDGSILTVDRNRCRVQFDRPELGVEFVQDIDAMPINPLDNMSDLMRKRRVIDLSGSGHGRAGVSAGVAARAALNERLDRPGSVHPFATPSQYFLNTLCRRAQMDTVDSVLLAKAAASEAAAAVQQASHGQPHSSIQAQAREADICALAELSRQLDKKEALLVELRRMNDEADRTAGEAESIKSSEAFRRQYATVVLQLKDVNKQVSAALLQLRQRNRYQENLVPPWHSPSACASLDGTFSDLSAGSPAEEITLSARKEARSMVSAAVQAICCLKEGEDTLFKLGKALNFVDGQPAKEGTGLGLGSNANLQPANLNSSDKGDSLQHAGTDASKNQGSATESSFTSGMEAFIPTELVASCVATLLMIQTCTERHLPPSDVAVMFENALANLRPKSAQNHQLYKEIEQCFDVIKNQVTAQVSIQSNISLPVDCHLR